MRYNNCKRFAKTLRGLNIIKKAKQKCLSYNNIGALRLFFQKLKKEKRMMDGLMPLLYAFLGTLVTLAGTMAGSALVFFTKKELSLRTEKLFLGFASGVMIAASVWSLLLPAMEYSVTAGTPQWLPAGAGFLLGSGFLLVLDKVMPHQHRSGIIEGPSSRLKKSTKLIFAVTLHNFPEGMAVGLAFAIAAAGGNISYAAAFALAVGIAIQNLPEGAVISLPLRNEGFSRKRAFFYGTLSGLAEPIAGVLAALVAYITLLVIPWVLSFAAGAMIYVVIDELVPNSQDEHTDIGTIGAIAGFVLMMLLDVVLG